jgi:hypothetical protein
MTYLTHRIQGRHGDIPERDLEPPESNRKCECGADFDDHADAPSPEVMKAALEDIISRADVGSANDNYYDLRDAITGIAERGLRIVSDDNSDCRKFVPADPDDSEGDYRFDSARDRRGE